MGTVAAVETGKELAAVMDKDMLEKMAGMVKQKDEGNKVPILKINYDDESKYEKGAWVVGQEKDNDGNITNEGSLVKGLVILIVMNRYNYYNQTDSSKNCSSTYHEPFAVVRGFKHGYVCGKTCPYRAEDAAPRCKAQKVVFGVAFTEDKKAIDCISYIQGDSYMPFNDYMESMVKVKTKDGLYKFPPFAFMTALGSEKKKNKGTVYWAGTFTRGSVFNVGQTEAFSKKADQVLEYLERLKDAPKKTASAAGTMPARSAAEVEDDVPPFDIPDGDVFDMPMAEETGAATHKEKPMKAEGKEVASHEIGDKPDSDYDIEAAIRSAMATKAA